MQHVVPVDIHCMEHIALAATVITTPQTTKGHVVYVTTHSIQPTGGDNGLSTLQPNAEDTAVHAALMNMEITHTPVTSVPSVEQQNSRMEI